ncbi:alkaline phosphatase family protein [Vibrio mediterranei]|uniref:Alkaline phosphatase n=1 Tax=Vibrio mediterranei TaxID=689 RepID=A0ABX5DK84_9VIBR|nr:alkaline phosphatase family protein [Vibrio mediterranei]PCD90187.1 alkaline phosphatase [Vibrio mediterranei]PRQ69573.1 alkaline phosphatase [Vibrio mediterranei]
MKSHLLVALALGSCVAPVIADEQSTAPKLILQITVDALRGDLPDRFRANMKQDGFGYLLDNGVHYANAHYQHANTETIVGHVALATGAPPSANGMVGNVWYDRSLNRAVYNIEDPAHSELVTLSLNAESVQLDDTQNTAQGNGRSPVNIHTSTFADELIKSNNGQSRAFAVSYKDRGAVSMAGELGKAFWFSNATGGFVTSDYYYDDYPNWVQEWNQKDFIERYSNKRWELMLDKNKYLFSKEGNTEFKTKIASFKRSFPYPYGPSSYAYFTTMLSMSPASDEITADFAKTLIMSEKLGQQGETDFLAISFSANDYIIHANGPSSLEAEDGLLRLDAVLSDLFAHVDEAIGLNNTLIVLSADHGAPDAPSYISNHGRTSSEYFGADALRSKGLFEKTKAKFGVGEEVYLSFENPNLYLNHELIQKKNLDITDVQRFIARELTAIDGVDSAFTASDIEEGNMPNTRVAKLVENNYFKGRSGDLYLVFNPGVYINAFDSLSVASVHGSPWRYDTFVPVIFAGFNLEGQKVHREVTPYDIAPTLSAVLGITFPSGSTGKVLSEIMEP